MRGWRRSRVRLCVASARAATAAPARGHGGARRAAAVHHAHRPPQHRARRAATWRWRRRKGCEARAGWLHILQRVGRKGQLLRRLEHNARLFCSYINWFVSNTPSASNTQESVAGASNFNNVRFNILLRYAVRRQAVCGCASSRTSVYLATAFFCSHDRIDKTYFINYGENKTC